MTHKKTEVAKKLKSLPDLLGAINVYYDCSTGLDIRRRSRHRLMRLWVVEFLTPPASTHQLFRHVDAGQLASSPPSTALMIRVDRHALYKQQLVASFAGTAFQRMPILVTAKHVPYFYIP